MAFVVSIAFSVLVIYIIYLVKKNWRYYYLLRKLPSPKGHFIIGNAIEMARSRDDSLAFLKMVKPLESSSVICLWVFNIPYIILAKCHSAEVLLSSNQEIEKSSLYDLIHPWLGHGLLTSSGSQWRRHRKLLTPSFHFRILENFIPIFNEQSQILASILDEQAEKGIFDMYPYMTRCTLDIICETAMGSHMETQLGKNDDYLNALTTVAGMVYHRALRPWLTIPWIFDLTAEGRKQKECLKILHGFTENVIRERREEYEKNLYQTTEENDCNYVYGRKKRKAFLDTLLEASYNEGIGLTDEMIREETDTFMFEGHDTTAVNLTWVIFFLGWCPSVQEIVHQELDRVFGNSDRPVEFEDINELRYLEAVIKETLRIVPSVPLFGRRLINETDIGGYTFPSGAEVAISPFLIGNDSNIYPNAYGFDPSRFLTDDFQKRHPYAYVPFSAGPRNCIGQKFAMMEEKVILANVFRKFEVRTHHDLESAKALTDLVYRPINGIHISLERKV